MLKYGINKADISDNKLQLNPNLVQPTIYSSQEGLVQITPQVLTLNEKYSYFLNQPFNDETYNFDGNLVFQDCTFNLFTEGTNFNLAKDSNVFFINCTFYNEYGVRVYMNILENVFLYIGDGSYVNLPVNVPPSSNNKTTVSSIGWNFIGNGTFTQESYIIFNGMMELSNGENFSIDIGNDPNSEYYDKLTIDFSTLSLFHPEGSQFFTQPVFLIFLYDNYQDLYLKKLIFPPANRRFRLWRKEV